jgi:hypothetical protein
MATNEMLSDARSAFVKACIAVLDDEYAEARRLFGLAALCFRAADEDEKADDAEQRADECAAELADVA